MGRIGLTQVFPCLLPFAGRRSKISYCKPSRAIQP